jgi:hypothetical protein
MKNKEIIVYGNYLFTIDRYIYESDEMFYYRINYIYNYITKLSNNNNKKYDLDEIIGLSKIESEKYFKQCSYE